MKRAYRLSYPVPVIVLILAVSCGRLLDEKKIKQSFEEEIVDGIESFFTKEMTDHIAAVESFSNDECLILNILTDNHISGDPNSIKSNRSTLRNLAYISKHTRIDGVVHLGDLVAQNLYLQQDFTDDDLNTLMDDYLQRLEETSAETFVINGNHDGPKANGFDETAWESFARKHISKRAKFKDGCPYYYVDYPEQNLRCVFLALPDNDPKGNTYYGFYNRSMEWLAKEALDVEDGTDIIIFGHIPTITASYMSSGHMINLDSFVGVTKAFNEHGKYKDRLVSCDFGSLENSKILAYVGGHLHSDLLVMPDYHYEGSRTTSSGKEPFTYNARLSFPEIIIGRNYFYGDTDRVVSGSGGVVYARAAKKASQDLWDTMIFDPENRKLHFIRFGAGEDRHLDL